MKRPVEGVVLFAALLSAAMAMPARADDVSDGQIIARQWCASCHAIGRDPQTIVDRAPAFAFMARNPDYTPERLEGWLLLPLHPAMQGIELSRVQIRQIRAYIQSLKN